jgi:hypothetical protein
MLHLLKWRYRLTKYINLYFLPSVLP